MGYYADLITLVGIRIIAVSGLFALAGLTGMFSLAHGAFMAIGAYTAVLTSMRLGVPWPVGIVLGMLVSCAVSAVVGYPALKLRRDYFALATFGFSEAITAGFVLASQVTGGALGLAGIPRHSNVGVVLALVGVSIYMVASLKNSKLGRNCLAIRSDELAAEALGIDVFGHKMQVFVFSAALAAMAGGLQAFFMRYMDPNIFGVWTALDQVIIIYFGGIDSFTGCIIAALVLNAVPEIFRFLLLWYQVIASVLIIVTLNLRPQGLMGDHEFSLTFLCNLASRVLKARTPAADAGRREAP